jgi:hypothetical protein
MKNNIRKQTKTKENASLPAPARGDLPAKINAFFEKRQSLFFAVSILLSLLTSVLLFDVKVSLSGDDCDYILGADDFWRHFTYPGAHGAVLYQMILSPFAGLSGMNLILLKSLSALFLAGSMWLFYKSFRNRVPAAVWAPAMLLVGVCSYVFFYASHTYSEAFFMLMQGLFVYFFSRYFLREDNGADNRRPAGRSQYLLLASLALGLLLARPIGFGVWGAIALFFAIRRRWKDLLYLFGAFALLFVLFSLLKSALWPETATTIDLKAFLAKDPYNPALGTDDFQGFVSRFTQNSLVYLSSFLYQFMGLLPDFPSGVADVNTIRCLVIYVLYAGCLAIVFRRNDTLLFIGLYVGVMNFVSFVALQSIWNQDRLILIYYPFILLFFLGGMYYLFQIRILKKAFPLYPLCLLALLAGTLSTTKGRVEKNLPVLQQNILGDPLYGLSPDWENFIKGSRWAAKNLPREAVIVSRKPTISKVYTGRDFTTLPASLNVTIDSLVALKDRKGANSALVAVDVGQGIFVGERVRYLIVPHVLRSFEFMIDGVKATNGVCVYEVPNELLPELTGSMAKFQMQYILDFDNILEQCRNKEFLYIHDPEAMLRYLLDQQVNYLLLPQLRLNPQRNTGEYINTIHIYREIISFKYPDRFRTIHTIGGAEPCEIVEFVR